MAGDRFLQSYGNGIVLVDEPSPTDIPMVLVGTVNGIQDEEIDGDDITNENFYRYIYVDINGVKEYTVDQRVITRAKPWWQYEVLTTGVKALMYEATQDGMVRVHGPNVTTQIWINDALSYNAHLRPEEEYARPFALKTGDQVWAQQDSGSDRGFLSRFLPYVYTA